MDNCYSCTVADVCDMCSWGYSYHVADAYCFIPNCPAYSYWSDDNQMCECNTPGTSVSTRNDIEACYCDDFSMDMYVTDTLPLSV